MDRRTYLTLGGGALAGLAGCVSSPFSGGNQTDGADSTGGCPDLLDTDLTRCPDEQDGPLSVDRTRETVSGVAWSLRVTVTNHATQPYGCNPFAWSVFRSTGTGWRRAWPAARNEPSVELAPGDHIAWQLSTGGAGQPEADQQVFLDLEPGRYAFVVPFRGPDQIATVAPFSVTA